MKPYLDKIEEKMPTTLLKLRLSIIDAIGPGKKVNNDAVGQGLTNKVISNIRFELKGMKAYNFEQPTKDHQELYVRKR
jgi:hypothetical protein